MSLQEELLEYCMFVDSAEKTSHTYCQAKIPQSAVNVKRIHVMFKDWCHYALLVTGIESGVFSSTRFYFLQKLFRPSPARPIRPALTIN